METSAGGVVYRMGEDGAPRFLLIRDPYENWGLPKGHLEGRETPREAAVREVREETGLADLRLVGDLPTIDWYFRDGAVLVHKYCHFFLLESAAGEAAPQLDEGITACVWHPFTETLAEVSYANARSVIEAAGKQLGLEG